MIPKYSYWLWQKLKLAFPSVLNGNYILPDIRQDPSAEVRRFSIHMT